MLKNLLILSIFMAGLGIQACTTHHTIKVEPMEMTINVNVNVKVDQALEDFFGDIDAGEETNTPDSE